MEINSKSSNYITELDGLRAIAIISVLLFHVGFKFIAGGYLGVDMFYVISGFLITKVVHFQLQQHEFSFIKFYESRVNRLLPALFTMLIACLFVPFLLFNSLEIKEYLDSSIAVLLYVSNYYFYAKSGYFAREAILLPLLHTWSLAVEEQFYLMHPILLYILNRTTKNQLNHFSICLMIFSISLIYSISCDFQDPEWGFFSIFSRLWELMLGCLIVQIKITYKSNIPNYFYICFVYLGIVIIIIMLFKFQGNLILPTIERVLVTTATAICIFAVDQIDNVLLSNPVLTYIGRISYSMYLVHQPLIAFYCKAHEIEISIKEKACLVVVTVFLASITYQGVEQPFRNKENSAKYRRILIIVTFVLLIAFSSYYNMYERGILIIESKQRINEIINEFSTNNTQTEKGWNSFKNSNVNFSNKPLNISNNTLKLFNYSNIQIKSSELVKTCDFDLIKKSKPGTFPFKYEDYGLMKVHINSLSNPLSDCNQNECRPNVISSQKYKIVLLGDSTAHIYSLPLTLALRKLNISGITITKTCGFVDNTLEFGLENKNCIGHRTKLMKELLNQISDNGTVILMINHVHNFKRANYNPNFINDTMVGLRALLALRYRVVLVYPDTIPTDYNIAITKNIYAKANSTLYDTTRPYSEYYTRPGAQSFIDGFDSLGKVPRLLRVYPNKVFCESPFSDRCNLMDCNAAYIADVAHYTHSGASLLIKEIINVIMEDGVTI